jgi:hypothetical protein
MPPTASNGHSDADAEMDRIARYESIQREVCSIAGAPFVAPDYDLHAMLAPIVVAGHELVYGQRSQADDWYGGWSFIADNQPKPTIEEMQFEHLRHLVTIREDLVPYLGLPVGWTFAILIDGSWYAWSPKDQLRTWIDSFLARTDATPSNATAIAEHVDEHYHGTALADRTIEPLRDWARRSATAAELDELLRWSTDWLERNGGR